MIGVLRRAPHYSRVMPRLAGRCFGVLFGLAWFSAPHAQAEPRAADEPVEAEIDIEQAPGSEVCPDKEAVFRSIRRLFPERDFRQSKDASRSTARARVTIRPLSPGHEAVLTLLPPRAGERVIREQDEDCRGLADALALAFVMLVAPPEPGVSSENESDATKSGAASAATSPDVPGAAPPSSKPAVPQKKTRAPDTVPASPRGPRLYRAGVGASLVGGLGVLSEPALGFAAELELFHRTGFGLSLQGLRLWSEPAEGQGGSVTLTLWGLLVAPCYRHRLGPASRLDACLRVGVGSQHAEVKGFLSPQSGGFPWLVLVPSLGFRQGFAELERSLSGFVRVGLVGQLRPQAFSVRLADGSDVQVASAPKVGVMTEVGLMFGADVF
jgi:hypothetical protein